MARPRPFSERYIYYTGPDIPQEEMDFNRTKRKENILSGKLFELTIVIVVIVAVLALIHPNDRQVQADQSEKQVVRRR